MLAPLSIVAFALALVVVVATAGTGSDGPDRDAQRAEQRDLGGRVAEDDTTTTEEAGSEDAAGAEEDSEDELPDDVYVIQPGDTLGAIAERVGISVERLQELNPDIDPQALVSGQQLKLRE